ncbi:MAG TPA: hypothetical protein VF791_03445 [Pyrinomonadaceae bacterium]
MKIRRLISIIALLLSGFAAAPAVNAQTGGQSANGSYQFSLEDGRTKYVEFDARTQEGGGGATGQMFFSDDAEVTYQDVDGAGDPQVSYNGFYLRAEFDGLVVINNQAIMSGTVRDSSIADLIGQRVLLTVEDSGDNAREPDKLTWGVYRPAGSWETSDAELETDPGVGLTWETSDAERRDDVPIQMPGTNTIGTQTFPFSAYAFVDLEQWSGDIRVQP